MSITITTMGLTYLDFRAALQTGLQCGHLQVLQPPSGQCIFPPNQLPHCHRQEVDCNYPLIDIDHTNATTSLKTFHRYYVMSQNEKRQNQVSYKAKTCLNTLPKYLFGKL